MTDTLDEPRDNASDTDDIFHFEQRDNTWYRVPENVRYGRPQMLKEKKASHTRRMRPMECDVFHDMHANAKQWEAFVGRVRKLDSLLVGGEAPARMSRISRDLRVPLDVIARAMAETFVIAEGAVDETE